MSDLTIKLIIILIPGAIATLIFGKLVLHKEWSSFRFVLYSILFGIISYLILQVLINSINLIPSINIIELTIWSNLNDANQIPYREVIFASLSSIIVAFFTSMIENRKIIYRIANKLGISNKYGEENLYSRFLSSKSVEYIYLRDVRNKLTYLGWIKSFCETDLVSEIRLADVSVYEYDSSDFLYSVKEVYLSLNKQEIIIETANILDNLKPINNGQQETQQKE